MKKTKAVKKAKVNNDGWVPPLIALAAAMVVFLFCILSIGKASDKNEARIEELGARVTANANYQDSVYRLYRDLENNLNVCPEQTNSRLLKIEKRLGILSLQTPRRQPRDHEIYYGIQLTQP